MLITELFVALGVADIVQDYLTEEEFKGVAELVRGGLDIAVVFWVYEVVEGLQVFEGEAVDADHRVDHHPGVLLLAFAALVDQVVAQLGEVLVIRLELFGVVTEHTDRKLNYRLREHRLHKSQAELYYGLRIGLHLAVLPQTLQTPPAEVPVASFQGKGGLSVERLADEVGLVDDT